MKRRRLLDEAIRRTDLPALISEHYPESGCSPGKAGVFFAAWRGNVNTPALSLSLREGVWLWHDLASGDGGNAFHFLVTVLGLDRQEAAHTLLERAQMPLEGPRGKGVAQHLRPIPRRALAALTNSEPTRIPAMAGRGFSPALLSKYQITTDNGKDALIPITDPDGVIVQVKRRIHGASGSGKYRYEHTGHGAPAWCSDNALNAQVLLVVEGECLPGEAEVLTPTGWQRLDSYDGSPVMQHNDDGGGEFVTPIAYIRKPFDGELVEWRSKGFASITTPGHRLIAHGWHGELVEARADRGHKRHYTIPRAVRVDGPGLPLSEDEIALVLAVSADGFIAGEKDRRRARFVKVGVSKARKVTRLRGILERAGVEFREAIYPSRPGFVSFEFAMPDHLPLDRLLPWPWLVGLSHEQREFILAELVHWDGNLVPNRNQLEYSSKEHGNASWVQALAHTTGRVSTIIPRSNRLGSWYKVSVLHGKSTSSWQRLQRASRSHRGDVYCVQVPSGRILVRQENRVTVTGNCNAIIAHASLQEAGDNLVGVVGVAGAKAELYEGMCHGKAVYIYADNDEAGEGAREAWVEAARDDGARSVHVMPAQDEDFCDYAGRWTRLDLATLIEGLMAASEQVYGALDRLIGRISVRELIASAERFYNGGVVNPTGIKAIDHDTGGIRESGLYAVGGLSSMGKSAFMRRILLEHVKAGGRVKLYSPDQSPSSVYRILASQLAGIPIVQARSRRFSDALLNRYGSEARIMTHLRNTYERVLTEVAPRFIVTEEGEFDVISKDMIRAVEQGVTMIGVDYIQVIEPKDYNERDGQVAKDFQKVSHRLRVPVVAAMQLAKYKFPSSRRDGTPVLSDIEGAGAYFQACEMIFMVYNEHIYTKRYLGDHDAAGFIPISHARIYLRKDKEGDGHLDYPVIWSPSLVTFYDPQGGVKSDRDGLLE